MSNLERAVERVRPALTPAWNQGRAEAVARALALRRRRRRRTAAVAATAVVGLIVVAAAARLRSSDSTAMRITRLGEETRVEVTSLDEGGARVALERGSAWFDAPSTPITVTASDVEVSFVSTRVLVAQVTGGVRVFVERGDAVVRWPGGAAALRGGDRGAFPPSLERGAPPTGKVERPAAPEVAVGPPVAPVAAREQAGFEPAGSRATASVPPVREDVRPVRIGAPVPGGEPSAGPAEPPPGGPTPEPTPTPDGPPRGVPEPEAPVDTVAALLLRADMARAAGHSENALVPLRQIVVDYPSDARAPAAAFTLGRVLLESLHRPAEAADAFALARRLAPDSVLSEDALAREMDARYRAGQRDAARALAREYEARYPHGDRLEAVRHEVQRE